MNNKIRQMVYAGLLTALAIIIPIQFGFLKIIIPPFTATLAAHVPMMLAMLNITSCSSCSWNWFYNWIFNIRNTSTSSSKSSNTYCCRIYWSKNNYEKSKLY